MSEVFNSIQKSQIWYVSWGILICNKPNAFIFQSSMHSLAKKEFANPFFLNGIIWIKLLPVGFQFLIQFPSSTHSKGWVVG